MPLLLKSISKLIRLSIGKSKITTKKPYPKLWRTYKISRKSKSIGINLSKWKESIIFRITPFSRKLAAEVSVVSTKSKPGTQVCTEPPKESKSLDLTNPNSKNFSKKWSSWCLLIIPTSLNSIKSMTTNLITSSFWNFAKEANFSKN